VSGQDERLILSDFPPCPICGYAEHFFWVVGENRAMTKKLFFNPKSFASGITNRIVLNWFIKNKYERLIQKRNFVERIILEHLPVRCNICQHSPSSAMIRDIIIYAKLCLEKEMELCL